MGQSLQSVTIWTLLLEINKPLKVDIKTQQGEYKNNMIYIYVPVLKTGKMYALMRFLTLLKNIIAGQSLNTGMQM